MRHGARATEIQYFDVDASESARSGAIKHYQIMHIPVTEDVSDPKSSDYCATHKVRWFRSRQAPARLAFRPDADLAHEIFHDRSFKIVYCTDEFALRVLRAGCSGAFFFDPPRSFGDDYKRIRTLRGVEEVVKWSRGSLRTKLVQEMP